MEVQFTTNHNNMRYSGQTSSLFVNNFKMQKFFDSLFLNRFDAFFKSLVLPFFKLCFRSWVQFCPKMRVTEVFPSSKVNKHLLIDNIRLLWEQSVPIYVLGQHLVPVFRIRSIFFWIRIRGSGFKNTDPDPTGSGSGTGSCLNMFLMFCKINIFYGIFLPILWHLKSKI